MADSGYRSPDLRRWVAWLSIVALVVEDTYGVVTQLLGVPGDIPHELAIASMVLFACGCVAFLSWVWRAHKNLWELGVGGIEVTPGWAVGWWFIPLANLFKPYLSMRELWWASDASDEPSRGLLGAGSALPLVWWLSFLLYNFTLEGIEPHAVVTAIRVVTAISGVISAACILPMMRTIDARQNEMNSRPTASEVSDPPPLLR